MAICLATQWGPGTVFFNADRELRQAVVAWYQATSVSLMATQRMAGARACLNVCQRAAEADSQAWQGLSEGLFSPDPALAHAAARVLSHLDGPEAGGRLLHIALHCRDDSFVDPSHLARLGRLAPLPAGVLPGLNEVRAFERAGLARALFRHPSDLARQTLDRLLDAGFEFDALEAAIDGIVRWKEPELLWRIVQAPRLRRPAGFPASFAPPDIGPHALFGLALGGDAQAVQMLVEVALDRRDEQRATYALLRLSWLAQPLGLSALVAALRMRRRETLELAIEAAAGFMSPKLAPALLDLAARKIEQKTSDISERACSVAGLMSGVKPLFDPTEIEASSDGLLLAPPVRRQWLDALRSATSILDPTLRYRGAQPLSWEALSEDMTSPDEAVRISALYNLWAMRGEGTANLEPMDDIVANLEAIEQAQALSLRPEAALRGLWWQKGVVVPCPQ
jgi:hypothetical protein